MGSHWRLRNQKHFSVQVLLHAGGGLAVPLAGRMLGVYAYHFWMSSMDKIAQRLCVSPDRRKHGALKLF